MFTLDQSDKKCYMMPHNRMRNVHHPHKVFEHSEDLDDHLYVLQCTNSQENILKNNEAFTHTLSGIIG